MNGIIIIDKPSGWTSHDVVAKLRGVLKIKRIGHSGTLDPMATGVLPVFIGRATRAVEFMVNSEKEYVAGLKLGIATDTQDITGNVLSVCDTSVATESLSAVITGFLGVSMQIPPMYSAVRHKGKKLYELARRGIEVQRPAREITVSVMDILDGGGSDYLLRIVCSKGTYIRTICHDIGAALGCGGVMSSLRRTMAGTFSIDMAHTLDEILEAVSSGGTDKIMLPVDSVFMGFPAAILDEKETQKAKNGMRCALSGISDGKYRFYSPDKEFLMLGEAIDGEIKMIKGFI